MPCKLQTSSYNCNPSIYFPPLTPPPPNPPLPSHLLPPPCIPYPSLFSQTLILCPCLRLCFNLSVHLPSTFSDQRLPSACVVVSQNFSTSYAIRSSSLKECTVKFCERLVHCKQIETYSCCGLQVLYVEDSLMQGRSVKKAR